MGLLSKLKTWMMGTPEDDVCGVHPEERPPREREDAGPGTPGAVGRRRVVLLEPKRFVDAGNIADHLCQGYTVLLNLKGISTEAARRIVDFLSGSAYAKDAQILHIACQVYLLAPYGVDVLDLNAEVSAEEDGWTYDDAFGF